MGLWGESQPKGSSRNAIQPWEVGTITGPRGNPSSGVLLPQEPLPCPSHSDPSPLALLCRSPCPESCHGSPPSPAENPPDHVQEDVGYGGAHSRLLGSRAHCRACQVLEPLPGPAPRQLLVPAAQSCRDTRCFPSDPPDLVSFFPEAREQIFSPNSSRCHVVDNLELLLTFSFLGSAFSHQPGCRVSGAELCPGT